MICNNILFNFKLSQWLRVPACILISQTNQLAQADPQMSFPLQSWPSSIGEQYELCAVCYHQMQQWSGIPPSHGWCLSCFISADKQLLLFVSFILYIGKTITARNWRGRNHYLCTIVVTELLGLLKISISFCFLTYKCFLFCPLLFQQLNHQILLH